MTNEPDYLDLSQLKTYTIDDLNTLEIDDAISLGLDNSLWIHIALPSNIIQINSELAHKALKKACTVYNSDKTVYMFPKELSHHRLSLKQGKTSIALSINAFLENDGQIVNFGLYRTIIKPNYKLTYQEADEILDYQPKEEDELIKFYLQVKKHLDYRKRNGL